MKKNKKIFSSVILIVVAMVCIFSIVPVDKTKYTNQCTNELEDNKEGFTLLANELEDNKEGFTLL